MSSQDMINIYYFLFEGVKYTLIVTLTCFASALVIGLTVAVLRRLVFPSVKNILDILVFIFRGIPVLIAVFLVYFGLPAIGLSIPPLLAMNISIGLISGSYLAEVFRGALQLVDPSEITAAKTAGLGKLQIIRYIELPQMLRFSVPGVANEFSSVLKATPFAYTVGIPEITKQAMSLTAVTMNGLAIYTLAAILYFLIYKLSIIAVRRLEMRFQVTSDGLKNQGGNR
ncbi:amino acid ABC transporter permease [Pectobacterium brasiliense]|uniref:amino acid ABC transporter permease n=1 Tax=Pectobacterium TaxID=122277 RepID=UPI000582E56C|nr:MULTISPECIES: amino acid ABC transporter permease [Pectobacterium]APS31453.1 polar amino acid ABC transporter ATP-binding protein [Pectobacterium brasiliense]KHS83149.1 polar amino acid ABC transporter ATP-binding protein [Pectobacterium carotovorum subsp. carotovorum]MBN3099389.1 amino acid ABC transporter permease [Pectobacterium brasiliense]MBN3100371.1 amino acid ABC transporter permease [Pectobacterium brasiliense]MBN3166762.1 amino acid ABC transporter permease [Pectobacterium brasili